jgi:hypothetical protein
LVPKLLLFYISYRKLWNCHLCFLFGNTRTRVKFVPGEFVLNIRSSHVHASSTSFDCPHFCWHDVIQSLSISFLNQRFSSKIILWSHSFSDQFVSKFCLNVPVYTWTHHSMCSNVQVQNLFKASLCRN